MARMVVRVVKCMVAADELIAVVSCLLCLDSGGIVMERVQWNLLDGSRM